MYRFCYEVQHDPPTDYPHLESIYANTRVEADVYIEQMYKLVKNNGFVLKYTTEVGRALSDVEAGDEILYYSGTRRETFSVVPVKVARTTQKFIYVEGYTTRFRRDGSEVSDWPHTHLERFDKRRYDDFWKKRADKRRLTALSRVDWLHLPEAELDEIYEFLQKKGLVPEIQNTQPEKD